MPEFVRLHQFLNQDYTESHLLFQAGFGLILTDFNHFSLKSSKKWKNKTGFQTCRLYIGAKKKGRWNPRLSNLALMAACPAHGIHDIISLMAYFDPTSQNGKEPL
ncbi:MAG: hypothetical protein IKO52_15320 [Clostridia bacterium]|nr:hypothetical protein [Clostridia bacterium]